MDAAHLLYIDLVFAANQENIRPAMEEFIRLANEVGEIKGYVAFLMEP